VGQTLSSVNPPVRADFFAVRALATPIRARSVSECFTGSGSRSSPDRNSAPAICVIQGVAELGLGLVELLFEHGLDIVECVLERWGYAPAGKEHFIRLGLSDEPVQGPLREHTAAPCRV